MRKTFEHVEHQPGPAKLRRRVSEKTTPEPVPMAVPTTRHTGKQPVKRTLADFFEESKSARARDRSRSAAGFRARQAAEAPF